MALFHEGSPKRTRECIKADAPPAIRKKALRRKIPTLNPKPCSSDMSGSNMRNTATRPPMRKEEVSTCVSELVMVISRLPRKKTASRTGAKHFKVGMAAVDGSGDAVRPGL